MKATTSGLSRIRISAVGLLGQANASTKITLYEDTFGNAYIRTYIPVAATSANQLRRMAAHGEIELEQKALPDEDFRLAEMSFLEQNHDQLARDYAGKWVAIDGSEVVASAGDLPTLLRLAAEAGHPNPFVTAIVGEPITSLYA